VAEMQKVAVITGAGTGIGKAVALALMREGYAAVLAGRRQEKLEETAREGSSFGGECLIITTDVSNPESIKSLFARTKERFGRLDLLFNNAGIGAPAVPIEELPYETWQKVVNNGSISAHAPRPRSVAYTATKHAVTGLTKSTSLDCRGYQIACGQIDIGNAATPLTERMAEGQGVMQSDGRMATEPRMRADDVGRAVVYMAGLPLDTNVLFMTVMANLMPFVGRG
jgi:NADP-dependent 3-hydroxy acid dehydrogenase YdfG